MILNAIDKLIFASLLVIFFQVPVFLDQYLQYLSGYHSALAEQVEAMRVNAKRHAYADVQHMIADFKTNQNAAVRSDAVQKEQLIQQFDAAAVGLDILQNGNVIAKATFLAQSQQWPQMQAVLANFQPGLSFNVFNMAYSFFAAWVLTAAMIWPCRRVMRKKKYAMP